MGFCLYRMLKKKKSNISKQLSCASYSREKTDVRVILKLKTEQFCLGNRVKKKGQNLLVLKRVNISGLRLLSLERPACLFGVWKQNSSCSSTLWFMPKLAASRKTPVL